MDAITMNKAIGQSGFNFAAPPNGYNFASPPDFSSGAWTISDKIPVNEFSSELVNSWGAPGYVIPPPGKFVKVNPDNDYVETQSTFFVPLAAYQFVIRESELLSEKFGFSENPFAFPLPPVSGTPIEFQQKLDAIFTTEYLNSMYKLWDKVRATYDSDFGGVITTEETEQWFNNILNFATGLANEEEIDLTSLGSVLVNPLDPPFDTYGSGDYFRFIYFLSNQYNILSRAYGTGKRKNLFPETDGFFAKLWSGIKKFNPVLIAMRSAFLGCVALNLFQIADKAALKIQSNGNGDIKKTWTGFGGNWSSLRNAINDGNKIGVQVGEVVSAAIIAAATPILLTFISLLDIDEDTEDVIQAAINAGGCTEYLASMSEFIGSFSLENVTLDEISNQFKIQFPDIPENCLDIVEEFAGQFIDVIPSGLNPFVPSGGGPVTPPGGGPVIPPSGGPIIDNGGESENSGSKSLLLIGGLLALFTLNR